MNIEKELNFFGLKREYSLVELKKSFRKIVLKEHPDVGGDRTVFERAMRYFETLEKACSNFESCVDKSFSQDKTIDGIPLSNLGKGYPITESAATCDVCCGNGYTNFHDNFAGLISGPCEDCFGTGILSYPCKKCGGSGKYLRNGKVIGECNLCNGSGRFYPENKRPIRNSFNVKYIPGTMKRAIDCKRCDGIGTVFGYVKNSKLLHRVCDKCDGIGEIKLFNPVLPRGFLMSSKA